MSLLNENQCSSRIGKPQIDLLEKLSNAAGVSGCENEIRKIILDCIRSKVDEFKIDAVGNILAEKHAMSANAPRVLFATHMDEVGFMLVEEDGEGLYSFEPVGGLDLRQLMAKPVIAGRNHIPGVIGCKPIHLTESEESLQVMSFRDMRIDVSPASAHELSVGDYATFATKFQQLGGSLFGKALNDRIGITTLIEIIDDTPSNLEVLYAFTAQEEIGLRGASVATFDFTPDMAFVIDCTPAFDLPAMEDGAENTQYNSRLGGGPVIYISDGGTISDPRLVRFLVKIAEENHIPYQFRQPGGGRTDAGGIHVSQTGIPTVSISIPGRYTHTPIVHCKISDWENMLALLKMIFVNLNLSILNENR